MYLALHGARHTLDNLIADGQIAPVVAVFLESTSPAARNDEMFCNPRLIEFLQADLLPWLAARYRVTQKVGQRVVAGVSGSGVGALEHPHLMLAPSRRLGGILRARGVDVAYSEPAGAHEYALWRGSFGDALRHVLPAIRDDAR